MKKLYEVKEEEGLERFDTALTKIYEYEGKVAINKDIKEL